jgi:hypothetical protein
MLTGGLYACGDVQVTRQEMQPLLLMVAQAVSDTWESRTSDGLHVQGFYMY